MPQHLREAAHRRHLEATDRATTALARLSAAGKAISFASVAREADVSTDFLYRQPNCANAYNRCAHQTRTTPTPSLPMKARQPRHLLPCAFSRPN